MRRPAESDRRPRPLRHPAPRPGRGPLPRPRPGRRRATTARAGVLGVLLLAGSAGSASAAEPPPAAPVDLTVLTGGDLLVHRPVWEAARRAGGGRRYAFDALLRPIVPIVAGADVAVCHAETPLVPGPPRGYPSFRTPPGLARSVRRTGYDVCSTASNHSLDAGTRGVLTTLRALRAAGVLPTGTSADARDRRRTPTVRTASGVRVAVLSYTETTNGIPRPTPWSVNLARAGTILADARRARDEGADAVVVSLHWGEEYATSPSAAQRALAARLTRSRDVTAIVGQHAHVPQPIRFAVRATRVEYVPTFVTRPGLRVVPALTSRASGARASARRTIAIAGRSARVRPVPR